MLCQGTTDLGCAKAWQRNRSLAHERVGAIPAAGPVEASTWDQKETASRIASEYQSESALESDKKHAANVPCIPKPEA
jgi:hypothetical protein